MKLITLLAITIGFVACSGRQEIKKPSLKLDENFKIAEPDSTQYMPIRDNLYYDKSGNLYLKAVDRSLAEGGTPEENEKKITNRWINVVYCDTCKLRFTDENTKQADNNQPDRMTELRNVVDTATFRLMEDDIDKNLTIYQDKNHIYYHHIMLDGGTISMGEKANKDSTSSLNKNKFSDKENRTNDSVFFKPIYFKKLQNYILKNGKTESVNISSRIDKPTYITYHVIEVNTIKLTVDESNRIYFSDKNSLKLGNILLSEDGLNLSFEDCGVNNQDLIWSTCMQCLKLSKIKKDK